MRPSLPFTAAPRRPPPLPRRGVVGLLGGLLGAATLSGCELVLPYLEEQRVDPSTIYWTGQVLDGPYSEDAGVFTGGTITLSDEQGAELLGADGLPLDAPYEAENSAGSWILTVPVDTTIRLRLIGEGFLNTVWTARTPSGRAYWFTGALFARAEADVDTTIQALLEGGLIDALPGDLANGEVAHLWAEPESPEDWVGASFAIVDSAGLGEILPLTVAEDGTVTIAGAEDPIYVLLAFDLAPGPVTFEAATPDGRHVLLSWDALGGDLLNASFLTLSGE